MTDKKPLRVMLCMAVQQNFFDATQAEQKDVWLATLALYKALVELPGVKVLGNFDDDRIQVGASSAWPWTTYFLCDFPDYETVVAACNLWRTTPVGDGAYKFWKYAKVEARIGRELEFPV